MGSEGDVVVGFGLVVHVRVGEVPTDRVEGEVIVVPEELLAYRKVHVQQEGGGFAIGPGMMGLEEEGGVRDVEHGAEGVDAGGEGGQGRELRSLGELVGSAQMHGHDRASASRMRWRVSASTVLRFLRAASRRAAVASRSMSRSAPAAWSW